MSKLSLHQFSGLLWASTAAHWKILNSMIFKILNFVYLNYFEFKAHGIPCKAHSTGFHDLQNPNQAGKAGLQLALWLRIDLIFGIFVNVSRHWAPAWFSAPVLLSAFGLRINFLNTEHKRSAKLRSQQGLTSGNGSTCLTIITLGETIKEIKKYTKKYQEIQQEKELARLLACPNHRHYHTSAAWTCSSNKWQWTWRCSEIVVESWTKSVLRSRSAFDAHLDPQEWM